jgi:hypothetical protein
MADPGQPLDDQRDAVQGPQLAGEPAGASPLPQDLFDLAELGVRQPGFRSRRASAAQGVGAIGLPAPIPQMHALAGNAELTGDLGLADTGGEQLPSTQPACLEAFAFMLCRRAAGDSWHSPILTRTARQQQLQSLSDQHPGPLGLARLSWLTAEA